MFDYKYKWYRRRVLCTFIYNTPSTNPRAILFTTDSLQKLRFEAHHKHFEDQHKYLEAHHKHFEDQHKYLEAHYKYFEAQHKYLEAHYKYFEAQYK